MKIIKRNGEEVEFNPEKIRLAIEKANQEVEEEQLSIEDISKIVSSIEDFCKNHNTQSVENIQDLVEEGIVKLCDNFKVGKQYITYRYKRELARSKEAQILKEVESKLLAKEVQNQNANIDESSFGGKVGEASDAVLKKLALEKYVSKMARDNHENNMIYIHDLNSYAVGNHNCLSLPIDKLLENGFNTRQCDIRPAGSISTAFQLLAVAFQLQSLQQFGGVSATHLDHSMEPYVKKSFKKHLRKALKYIPTSQSKDKIVELERVLNSDELIGFDYANKNIDLAIDFPPLLNYAKDLTREEISQSVEGMYHNLNTLQSRSGNQLPFSSINYGTCISQEGRMVSKALLEGSLKGTGKYGKTSIFPCNIFQCMKGVNRKEGDPNYDLFQLALQSTAKRLYPNYANVDWSGNEGYDIADPKTYFSTIKPVA